MDFDPFEEEHELETTQELFDVESDYMVAEGYFESTDVSDRRQEALNTILQYSNNEGVDPFIICLSMNYFDRYFSRPPLPEKPKGILDYFAICCFILASKMRECEFSITAFLNEYNLNMDMEHICRMELLILDKLKWRMSSVTPLCFVDFFISLFDVNDPQSKKDLKYHTTDILFNMLEDIKFTQFKPSIIAASALLAASTLIFPARFPELREAVSSCQFVKRDDLYNCIDTIMIMFTLMISKTIIPSDPTDDASDAATTTIKPEREAVSTEEHEEFEEDDDEAEKAKKKKK